MSSSTANPEIGVVDPITVDLALNLVVTCLDPVPYAPAGAPTISKDGDRIRFYPIVGGRFWGFGISGRVVPGGADYAVRRPNGQYFYEARYAIETDDGYTILVHNKGVQVASTPEGRPRFRFVPEFTVSGEKYAFLNTDVFVATLTVGEMMPEGLAMAGEGQNDRLIQVFRVV
ncbi:hypothetical protein DFJ74DRAFT_657153 [Hyaloraphidium curvatum]|nr:hypothetical protein DFJ74DRAFT_657153 [Hyaloraphidium curvatum]